MLATSTIFALATAQGRAGVAVFRISGPQAKLVIEKLSYPHDMPKPREASLRKIHDPQSSEPIDHGILLWFPAPHSFTGEDVVELHLHGGRAVTSAVVDALKKLPDFRLAEAGEFSRRAFENDKLDLTEAEAIADLVDAETEAQRRQALRQMEGSLGKQIEDWVLQISHTLAYFEASIDFADEDLPADVAFRQTRNIQTLIAEMSRLLDDGHKGERLREGFSIAILGPPNAGKSSLLNTLARREAAIVSSTAGTTRDIIEVHLDLGGYPVMLADTAGLRESVDAIEGEGVKRALHRAEQADLKIIVFDGSLWPQMDEALKKLIDKNSLCLVNKADLIPTAKRTSGDYNFISAQTGEGIPELLVRLVKEIDARFSDIGLAPLTRARHREALEECKTHLQRSLTAREIELRAEDVRLATRALGRITGRVDVEDLLDIIFRDFCIGK